MTKIGFKIKAFIYEIKPHQIQIKYSIVTNTKDIILVLFNPHHQTGSGLFCKCNTNQYTSAVLPINAERFKLSVTIHFLV